MSRRRIKILLSYDGSRFQGWQIQASGRTVQGVMEEALLKLHRRPLRIIAAGRTDTGVHARGQVCHFDSEMAALSASRFAHALNAFLPGDVRVLASEEVPADFHARHSAKGRVYRYYFFETATDAPPFIKPYCWTVRRLPPIQVLNRCAGLLLGEHDFSSFTAAGDPGESKIRSIFSSGFFQEGPFMVYRIGGTAFLWKMVRTIVGTIMETAGSPEAETRFSGILGAQDRGAAGTTAPPGGLFLEKVYYDKQIII